MPQQRSRHLIQHRYAPVRIDRLLQVFARWLLLAGLATMVTGSLVAMVAVRDIVFYAANFASVGASGVVLAYAIGSVAVAYQGVPRATALGIVYAAFGLGAAASPAVLTFFPRLIPSTEPGVPSDFTFDTWLAYLVTAVAAGVALWAARRSLGTTGLLQPVSPDDGEGENEEVDNGPRSSGSVRGCGLGRLS